ncbi:MAG: hypothetical protein AAFW87_03850 [Pseudomonadota bacterium]
MACPTGDDLSAGIKFTLSYGGTELHRRLFENWVVIDARFPDGTGSVIEAFHGLYMHSAIPIEDNKILVGQKDEFATRAETQQWDKPKPDSTWVNATDAGGAASAGSMEPLQLGECNYESFEIEVNFTDDPKYVEIYTYLPEFGVGLLTGTRSEESIDSFTYSKVEALLDSGGAVSE